jgi:DNA-directed RNA polymerase sigma subunit (sigma70/sigma32)
LDDQAGGVDHFVQQLMSSPPLAASDEAALARRARAGDGDARAALIVSGMRSVVLRARMLGLQGEELRDAVQSGAIGLIRAVDRYDPDRGARLATYAWRWIGAEIVPARHDLALSDTVDTPVRDVPPTHCDLLDGLPDPQREVLSLRFGLTDPAGIPRTRSAVAHHLGLTVSQVRTIEGKAMRQLREGLAKVADRAPHE